MVYCKSENYDIRAQQDNETVVQVGLTVFTRMGCSGGDWLYRRCMMCVSKFQEQSLLFGAKQFLDMRLENICIFPTRIGNCTIDKTVMFIQGNKNK